MNSRIPSRHAYNSQYNNGPETFLCCQNEIQLKHNPADTKVKIQRAQQNPPFILTQAVSLHLEQYRDFHALKVIPKMTGNIETPS